MAENDKNKEGFFSRNKGAIGFAVVGFTAAAIFTTGGVLAPLILVSCGAALGHVAIDSKQKVGNYSTGIADDIVAKSNNSPNADNHEKSLSYESQQEQGPVAQRLSKQRGSSARHSGLPGH